MDINRLARGLVRRLPETRLKRYLRWILYARERQALIFELSHVPVVDAGLDGEEQIPFVVLEDDAVLYGRPPSEFDGKLYERWYQSISPVITLDTIGVAIDVICRYLYPHAMPQLTLPYPRKLRRGFHKQHIETIEDLPGFSAIRKQQLKDVFMPIPGETFLDIGAYMGYGTIRLSKDLGPKSIIVAVEADPDNQEILRRNVAANNLQNVVTVPKAIWNQQGIISMQRSGRQANSIVDGIVSPMNTIAVETITVDNLLSDLGMTHVDIMSVTINGAELEAVPGMNTALRESPNIRLTMAGWYKRDGQRICDLVSPLLRHAGLEVAVGHEGGIIAWKERKG
jgi:FkbM family methyltransferase